MNENHNIQRINFGIFKEMTLEQSSGCFHSVLRLNNYQYIAASQKQLVLFENGVYSKSFQIASNCAIYLPSHDVIVLVTPPPTKMRVFHSNDLSKPALDDLAVDQIGVCQMMFSERNSILITIGIGVVTWAFDMVPKLERKKKEDLKVRITKLNHFADNFMANMLCSQCWIESKNTLALITKKGIVAYGLDGKIKESLVSLNSDKFSLYLYNNRNGKALTSDPDQGLCLWNKYGRMIRRITCITTPIFAAFFMTNEFVIAYDSSMYLNIIDIKTEQCFPLVKLDMRPSRIFFERNPKQPTRVIVCTQNIATIYRVVIPWSLWKRTLIKPKSILRCPRAHGAARISVLMSDSSIQFFSPSTKKLLTICHTLETGFPIHVLIDRGKPGLSSRDQVFVCLDNGKTIIFATNNDLMEPVLTLDNNASCCALSMWLGEWCLLIGTDNGDVLAYSYDKLRFKKKSRFTKERIYKIFFHEKTNSLFIVYKEKTIRFDALTATEKDKFTHPFSCINDLFGDLIVYGFDSGNMIIKKIYDDKLVTILSGDEAVHKSRVTGITSGISFFVTSSFDGTINVWTMDCEIIIQLHVPLHINSVAFLNGKRGLLIGTDNHIMIMNGSSLFGKNVDPEDTLFDNFDKYKDQLYDKFQLLDETPDEEEDMEFLKKFSKNCEEEKNESLNEDAFIGLKNDWNVNIPPQRTIVTFSKEEERTDADRTLLLKEMELLNGMDDDKPLLKKEETVEEEQNIKEESINEEEEEEEEESINETKKDNSEASSSNEPKETENQNKEEEDYYFYEEEEDEEEEEKILEVVEDLPIERKEIAVSPLSIAKTPQNNSSRKSVRREKKVNHSNENEEKKVSNIQETPKQIKDTPREKIVKRKPKRTLKENNEEKSIKKTNIISIPEEPKKELDHPKERIRQIIKNEEKEVIPSDVISGKKIANDKDGKIVSITIKEPVKTSQEKFDIPQQTFKPRKRPIEKAIKREKTHDNESNYQEKLIPKMSEKAKDSSNQKKSKKKTDDSRRRVKEPENTRAIEPIKKFFNGFPEYPNVKVRARNPRRVIPKDRQEDKIIVDKHDFLPPAVVFDREKLLEMIHQRAPEKRASINKLACFSKVADDVEEKSNHYIVSYPRNIAGLEEDTDENIAEVFMIDDDPPPLVEEPPYVERKMAKPRMIRNRDEEPEDPFYDEPEVAPRRIRPYLISIKERNESIKRLSLAAPQQETSFKPKIINPGQMKQNYNSLVSLFSKVGKRKTSLRSSRK